MNIVFVTPRYGADFAGGAERQALEYAERLAALGHEVAVYTTCSSDHTTWRNELPAGDSWENEVTIRRFPVTRAPDSAFMMRAGEAMAHGFSLPASMQEEWVMNTGYSDPMMNAIKTAAQRGDLLVFTPYLFASTVFGAAICPERSVIIPCLHDEQFARFGVIQRTLRSSLGLIFNSDAEARLAEQVLGGIPPHFTVGFGFDEPIEIDVREFRRQHLVEDCTVAYLGRRELGKNFPMVMECVTAYDLVLSRSNPARLLLMGGGSYTTPNGMSRYLTDLGFVSPAKKNAGLAASTLLVNLSRNESFSHALAEAWINGTPVIVHADCPVTREHCERSGGGVWIRTVEEFAAAVDMFRTNEELRSALGHAGRRYVARQYSWPAVMQRLTAAIGEFGGVS